MHAVVVDRVQGDPGMLARAAAAALGRTAYEVTASMNVPGGGPAAVAVLADPGEANAYAAALRNAGFHAAVVSVRDMAQPVGTFLARSFELGPSSLCVENREGQSREVSYGEVDLLIRATRTTTQKKTSVVREREFSLASSVFTGGLVNTRVKETTRTTTKTDADELLFVYTAGQTSPISFDDSDLLYQGLGASMQASAAANYLHLVTRLRDACPVATFDERLRRRATQSQILGRTLNPDDHLDFAVALIAASARYPNGSPFRSEP